MRENNSNGSVSIGFGGLLTIAFIVLKLTNVISWSWFWVLSPIVFSIALIVILVILVAFLERHD
jgi:hypothetical protein